MRCSSFIRFLFFIVFFSFSFFKLVYACRFETGHIFCFSLSGPASQEETPRGSSEQLSFLFCPFLFFSVISQGANLGRTGHKVASATAKSQRGKQKKQEKESKQAHPSIHPTPYFILGVSPATLPLFICFLLFVSVLPTDIFLTHIRHSFSFFFFFFRRFSALKSLTFWAFAHSADVSGAHRRIVIFSSAFSCKVLCLFVCMCVCLFAQARLKKAMESSFGMVTL